MMAVSLFSKPAVVRQTIEDCGELIHSLVAVLWVTGNIWLQLRYAIVDFFMRDEYPLTIKY